MTKKQKKHTVYYKFSDGDVGLLTRNDFNESEKADLRICSKFGINFEADMLRVTGVKIKKLLIHYDGITNCPQDDFGFKFDIDGEGLFKGTPSPIITFELNKAVDPDDFIQSIWISQIVIQPKKALNEFRLSNESINRKFACYEDKNGSASIIDRDKLDKYISQLSDAAFVPPVEIYLDHYDGDGYGEFELVELIDYEITSIYRPDNI